MVGGGGERACPHPANGLGLSHFVQMFEAFLETRRETDRDRRSLSWLTYLFGAGAGSISECWAGVRLGLFLPALLSHARLLRGAERLGARNLVARTCGRAARASRHRIFGGPDRSLFVGVLFRETPRAGDPEIARDTVAMLLFLIALLFVLSIGYRAQTQLKGVLAGSGVAAIILGFAAQNLISSLIAGMSLQIQRPYHGRLVKNRRHLRRGGGDPLGRDAACGRTTRFIFTSRITRSSSRRSQSELSERDPLDADPGGRDYTVPPNRVKDALMRATIQANRVLPEPPPKVFLRLRRIVHPLRDQVQHDEPRVLQRHVRRDPHQHLVRIPPPENQHPFPDPHPAGATQTGFADAGLREKARGMLRDEPLFSCLDDEQIERLVAEARSITSDAAS